MSGPSPNLSLLPLASALPDSFAPLPLVLIGFLFVVVVLAILALLTFVGGKIFARRGAGREVREPVPASSPPTADAIDPVTRAVIAAAVYAVLPGERVRIGRIVPARQDDSEGISGHR